MKKHELIETMHIMNLTLDQLLSGGAYSGTTGAVLARKINEIKINATLLIARSELGQQLKSCFDAAFLAGVSDEKMKSIRDALNALNTPSSHRANIMKITCYSLALILESRCIAKKAFQSRQEIDNYLDVMNVAFDEIEELSCDTLSDLFAAMNALRCAVMKDLTERSKPLPRLTAINLPKNLNSLVLAYNLYEDVDKAKELCQENSVVHPAFVPRSISALVN